MSNIQLVENLYRLRKAHHYTQQEISDLLNISRQAYSNYETSKRTPDLDSLMRLADIYGVSLDQAGQSSLYKRRTDPRTERSLYVCHGDRHCRYTLSYAGRSRTDQGIPSHESGR